jgi:Nucleotidyl transferase of unknown function (DUF2204)
MNHNLATLEKSAPDTFQFYRRALALMDASGIPYLLGGAYAFGSYTGITRHTKDLDLFVRPVDAARALQVFAAAGYRAEFLFSHWLAKAFYQSDFIDLIFSSGNGICTVDDAWFDHALQGEVLGRTVGLIPAEEMIWQKAYIMERERFDGADIAHLLLARGRQFDWDRLLDRFGSHWPVLYVHLVLFGFIYPGNRDCVPERVLRTLTDRLREPVDEPIEAHAFMGTLLSRTQYLADTEDWGYGDPRLAPQGTLTAEQVARWTDAGR